ncbi:hypothetical protein GYMLUDRAFT_262256 [Collybiopsis luxurians FD-317 M1]|uniref:Uncharacterized protein n=1 Tax=Collybiopsis luxurians FD-317 M1 TaxID=944289 RepID=A0A0D0C8P3_9AGAR|nr:hypothetical protein GYMLUDRAFT_262256 [Collybiopsis luxurians FD-317 M1]
MPSIFSRSKSNNSSSLPQLPLSAILPTDASGQFVDTLISPTPPSSNSHSGNSAAGTGGSYGFLSPYPNLILGLYDLQHLVSLISTHLNIETPFVFNSDALDLDAGVPPTLAEALELGGGSSTINFDEEAHFAGPHELGMLLHWALAHLFHIDTLAQSASSHFADTIVPLTPPSSSISSCGISAAGAGGSYGFLSPTQTSSTASSTLTRPTSVQVEPCRLIDKYVSSDSTINFDEEAHFTGPHELGMLFCWALARIVRIDTHSIAKHEFLKHILILPPHPFPHAP